jgi:DNA-binding CsgD family transcriptional regulator/PAS domain-containing protein
MADVSVESVSAAVAQIYEAAYDHQRWQDVVMTLCALFDGSRACIARLDSSTLNATATIHDPELCSAEAIAAHMRNPEWATAMAGMPIGMVFRDAHALKDADPRRREVWRDWHRPRDMYDGLSCNLLLSNDSYWFLDIHRGARQPEFDRPEIELLQSLAPHMLRAGEIGRSLGKISALASAFSHLPFGVLLVDRYLRVSQMNEAAEAMLARAGSPLGLKLGHVLVCRPRDNIELRRLVADACSSPDGAAPGPGGAMMTPSDHERLEGIRLVLSVAPYSDGQAYGLALERRAVILLRDVTLQNPDGFEEQLRTLFGLTRAEARVAASLAAGFALKEAAAQAGISFGTARNYLIRIFRKTGANQQGQLVALLKSVQPFPPTSETPHIPRAQGAAA